MSGGPGGPNPGGGPKPGGGGGGPPPNAGGPGGPRGDAQMAQYLSAGVAGAPQRGQIMVTLLYEDRTIVDESELDAVVTRGSIAWALAPGSREVSTAFPDQTYRVTLLPERETSAAKSSEVSRGTHSLRSLDPFGFDGGS